ncbi:hypothetical protein ES703_97039 [subsurface metagenome]
MHARASPVPPRGEACISFAEQRRCPSHEGVPLLEDLGRIIKQQRLMIPMTLRELAARSGVSSSHLGRIERGERFPSARILRKLAGPLDLGEPELLTHAGFLSPRASTTEIESSTGLDPYVAKLLSQEPVEVQRTLIGLLSILKIITRVKE